MPILLHLFDTFTLGLTAQIPYNPKTGVGPAERVVAEPSESPPRCIKGNRNCSDVCARGGDESEACPERVIEAQGQRARGWRLPATFTGVPLTDQVTSEVLPSGLVATTLTSPKDILTPRLAPNFIYSKLHSILTHLNRWYRTCFLSH
jgi:hypothetical protein